MKRKFLGALAFLIIFLVTFELGSALLAHMGFLHRDLPTYNLHQVTERFWAEIDPVVGVWHPTNSEFRHRRHCYDVTYRSNSWGMRDVERKKTSSKARTVVLGDSLIEGWGVSDANRLTTQLEKLTGKAHLNFGAAGYFGPHQYFLRYQSLAKDFDHDAVLVGIYPSNDFYDDDYEYWKETGSWKGWYKPFLVGEYPDYKTIYPNSSLETELSWQRYLVRWLREFSYSYTTAAHLFRQLRNVWRKEGTTPQGEAYSGYYDYTPEGWDRMRFSLERLRRSAQGKDFTVLLIPEGVDIQRYKKSGGENPLGAAMKQWAEKNHAQVIDLLPFMAKQKDWPQLYYAPCDEHPNEEGNRRAAAYVAGQMGAVSKQSNSNQNQKSD